MSPLTPCVCVLKTCLGLGKDQGKWAGPSCHLLNVSGAHLLLECPLDLSMLHHFLPAPNITMHTQDADMHDAQRNKRALSPMGALQTSRKRALRDTDDHTSCFDLDAMYALHAQASSYAHMHSSHVQSEANISLGFTSVVNGYTFLDVEPWYKTAEFGLLDVSSIDAVLVSNPEGMLGLPFLTRTASFSGKVILSLCLSVYTVLMYVCVKIGVIDVVWPSGK